MSSYVSPTPTRHEVNGEEEEFYALGVRMLFKLRNLAKPIAESMAVLFESHESDRGAEFIQSDDGTRSTTQPVEPALAAQRTRDREKSVGRLIETICDEKNGEILAEVVLDSKRERDQKKITKTQVEEFLDKTDVPTFVQNLIGVGKANAEVFGPVGERVALAAQSVLAKVGEKTESATSEAGA